MKKQIRQRRKTEDNEMFNSLLGSFLVSLKMLNSTGLNKDDLRKIFREEKKIWMNGDVNKTTWMEDLVSKMNKNYPATKTHIPYGKIAVVVSDFNMLIAPYVENEKGEAEVLPLRPDGFKGPTLTYGKIYPIVEEEEKNE